MWGMDRGAFCASGPLLMAICTDLNEASAQKLSLCKVVTGIVVWGPVMGLKATAGIHRVFL